MAYIPCIGDAAIIGIHEQVVCYIPYKAEHADKLNNYGYIGTLAVPQLYEDSS
jgi:hypothetical protein